MHHTAGTQVLRAFTNLIENALNYTWENGRVVVQASAESGRFMVAVSDTGIGILEKDSPCIFERFCRSEGAIETAFSFQTCIIHQQGAENLLAGCRRQSRADELVSHHCLPRYRL